MADNLNCVCCSCEEREECELHEEYEANNCNNGKYPINGCYINDKWKIDTKD